MADGFPDHAVHLVDGERAGGSVRELLGDAATIVTLHDVLSVGPLRPAASFDEWCSDRNAYWRNVLTSAPWPDDDPEEEDAPVRPGRRRTASRRRRRRRRSAVARSRCSSAPALAPISRSDNWIAGVGPDDVARGTTATLTDAGRDVLAGRANAVTLNGIDDFVAGVHLSSAEGRVFFRPAEQLPAT